MIFKPDGTQVLVLGLARTRITACLLIKNVLSCGIFSYRVPQKALNRDLGREHQVALMAMAAEHIYHYANTVA